MFLVVVSVFFIAAIATAITLGIVLSRKTIVKLYDGTYTIKPKSVKVVKPKGDVTILEYKNIPYATANRFEYPDICSKDNKCSEPSYSKTIECLQFDVFKNSSTGVEDCLVLTVRTPRVDGNLPVLVWIHGGGLIAGYGEQTNVSPRSDFVADIDAVVVSINYRLGILGFLSVEELTDDKLGTFGNYGHADQVAALKWVQKNIKQFGGDPKTVTLIGESAGATSLLALLVSPLANGTFRNVIPLSPALQWTVTNSEAAKLPETTEFVKAFGCNETNLIANCLRTIPSDYFVKINPLPYRGTGYFDFPRQVSLGVDNGYLTVVDGVIIEEAPKDCINLDFHPEWDVKVFLANTAQECGLIIGFPEPNLTNFELFKAHLTTKLTKFEYNTDESHFPESDATKAFAKIVEIYDIKNGKDSDYYKNIYFTIVTDIRSSCPTNDLTRTLSASSSLDTYRMFFSFAEAMFIHTQDILIGFGVNISDNIIFKNFRDEFRKTVKEIVHDNLSSDWRHYPSHVLHITGKGREYKDGSPQESYCELWKNYKMDYQYGWHN